MEVIISYNKERGDGSEFNPIRNIREVFTLDGELIMDYDHTRHERKEMISFAKYYSDADKDKYSDAELFLAWRMGYPLSEIDRMREVKAKRKLLL